MDDLIQAAKLFANISHQRINIYRNPRLQSPAVHLKAVAQIVSSVSQDAHMIAAAWLHDIVEDTGVTIGDVERKFGAEVAKLVDELTVVDHPAHASRTARFALEKDHFANVSEAAKTIKLADLIATCRDLHKNEPASLRTYAAEANELTHVLSGGDTRLLARLKRDLEMYASSLLLAEPPAPSRHFRPIAIPIAALLAFERAFTAVEVAEPLISFVKSEHTKGVFPIHPLDGCRENGA
jgi:(p)ppGpp synthase/HD superfamily hydrolase